MGWEEPCQFQSQGSRRVDAGTCRQVPYRAERLHQGRVVTVDIPDLIVPRCENCGELVFNYTAEEQILKAIQARIVPSSPSPPDAAWDDRRAS